MVKFGTDGVRGVANRDLTPEVVLAFARATASVLGTDSPILIARDTRASGPMIEAALTAGFCAEGVSVESAGVLPTPGIAHLAHLRHAPAVMISASHNPYRDNGIKVFAPGGNKIADHTQVAIEAAYERVTDLGADPAPADREMGTATRIAGSIDRYAVHLMDTLEGRQLTDFHVVLDCGHGAAYGVAPKVFRDLGARVEVINAEPNGININAGCGSTDPSGLAERVVRSGARAGFAFDGDADRVIAVDETGGIVDGDHMLAMFAPDLKARALLPGNAVVATVMSNLGLRRTLEPQGIDVIETPVGDRNVTAVMAQRGLLLGGEESGHVIFAAASAVGDGTLTALMIADLMIRSGRRLSELAGALEKLPQARREVRVAHPKVVADAIAAEVEAARVALGADGRVLVRASGTEPMVRVMVESTDGERAEAIAEALAAHAAAAAESGSPAGA